MINLEPGLRVRMFPDPQGAEQYKALLERDGYRAEVRYEGGFWAVYW